MIIDDKRIDLVKATWLLLICFFLQSCHYSELKIKIVNLSKNDVYLDGLSDDDEQDSRFIMMSINMYCSPDTNSNYPSGVLKAGDSTVMDGKLVGSTERMVSINVDSLTKYCESGDTANVSQRSWVRILEDDINYKTKSTRFVIK